MTPQDIPTIPMGLPLATDPGTYIPLATEPDTEDDTWWGPTEGDPEGN
jgi:hypothetical protein